MCTYTFCTKNKRYILLYFFKKSIEIWGHICYTIYSKKNNNDSPQGMKGWLNIMKEYYVDWINEDQDQIEGRKPHNDIRSDGELTEAETAEEAVENVRQWIFEQISGWTDADGNYYEWEAEEDNGDIIIWDIGGEEKS